jgi:hypothetical protein
VVAQLVRQRGAEADADRHRQRQAHLGVQRHVGVDDLVVAEQHQRDLCRQVQPQRQAVIKRLLVAGFELRRDVQVVLADQPVQERSDAEDQHDRHPVPPAPAQRLGEERQ